MKEKWQLKKWWIWNQYTDNTWWLLMLYCGALYIRLTLETATQTFSWQQLSFLYLFFPETTTSPIKIYQQFIVDNTEHNIAWGFVSWSDTKESSEKNRAIAENRTKSAINITYPSSIYYLFQKLVLMPRQAVQIKTSVRKPLTIFIDDTGPMLLT